MKIIRDIRLYKGVQQDGSLVTHSFAPKALNAIVHRIAMKLRECAFSMGEFDHLYITFTACDGSGRIDLSDKVDRYHSWYRHCTVGICGELFDKLGSAETHGEIIQMVGSVLTTCFAAEDFDAGRIRDCIDEAVTQGEQMRMIFKQKVTAKRKAVVYLRYLDSCKYRPLLCVYDPEDRLLLERDLPEAVTLDYLGELQVSAKKVTIKPRKNAFTSERKPLVIEYGM